jgi:hypothetical protein
MKSLMAVMMICAFVAPVSASAQDPGDAPGPGVARLSVLSGDVTVRRGDTGELIEAELNEPLVSRDHVLTDDRSRAEIQFDSATLLRVAPDSEVRLAELRDGDYLVQVVAGTVTLRIVRDANSRIEISAPTASLVPRGDGTYRITVQDDASTEMTVRAGEAEILIENTRDFLRAGQTLFVRGDPSNPLRAYRAPIPLDDWDRWNESRDRDLARSDSYKYVSRDIYGAEDLVDHGRWVYDAPYGWVWIPRVDVGWAPYRVGRWSWIDYYGWTWVSGDPWGWAPYHYGRWYYGPRYGWAWYPGGVTVRYTWRPALVAFFGWGTNVGWVPLAPYEVYRPWYGLNRTVFVNNVTVVNHYDVVNRYNNARFISGRSGVTSLASGDFGRNRITINNYIPAGSDRDFYRASDVDRMLVRQPDRGYRQPPNRPGDRRDDGRNNVRSVEENPRRFEDRNRSTIVSSSPSRSTNTARPIEPRRDDSRQAAPTDRRSQSQVAVTQPSRTPVETTRRSEPARGRAFESSPARIEPSPAPSRVDNNPRRSEPGRAEPARTRPFESNPGTVTSRVDNRVDNNVQRSEPRRSEPIAARRDEPVRTRTFESNPGRVEPSRNEPPAVRRDEPGRTRTFESPRAEPQRAEPQRSRPESSQGAPRNEAPATRSRSDDGGRSAAPAPSSQSQTPQQGQSQPQGNPGRGRGNGR